MKIIFALLLFLTACNQKPIGYNTQIFPKVIDSLPVVGKNYSTNSIETQRNYVVYYGIIDTKKITLNKEHYILTGERIIEDYNNEFNNDSLYAFVDTNQILTIDLSKNKIPPPPPPPILNIDSSEKTDSINKELERTMIEWENRPNEYINSYPIFILNPNKQSLSIELQDMQVIMIYEALNELNEWQPIEYWTYSTCGNSYSNVVIEPKHFIMSKIVKYQGGYKTKLRLKIKNRNSIFYSNVFNGFINKSQLDTKKINQELSRKINSNNLFLDK